MKEHISLDIGKILDEIFNAAEDFSQVFHDGMKFHTNGPKKQWWSEKTDFYPTYSYPPSNIYLTDDKNMVFEFALAGFSEDNINLQFRGDYMILSAKPGDEYVQGETVTYFKRRLKFKEIEAQKYFVPDDKFDREKVRAVYRNGILQVIVPPRVDIEETEGIKINIKKEGD